MPSQTVVHYHSAHYDLHISKSYGNLVLDGFVKSGETLKYLVWQVEDSTFIPAYDLILRFGRDVVRPCLLGQRCDGSIDVPVMALYLDFCIRRELDAKAVFERAYPGEGGLEPEAILDFAEWQGVQLPYTWTVACFAGLLQSLTQMNLHMLRSTLEDVTVNIYFPSGVMTRSGYTAFRDSTRYYGPDARFTWGYVVTPTGEKVWQYDPWHSKNGVVPGHYWLSFIAIAASRDGNVALERQVIKEALSVSRSKVNRAHYRWWLERLTKK